MANHTFSHRMKHLVDFELDRSGTARMVSNKTKKPFSEVRLSDYTIVPQTNAQDAERTMRLRRLACEFKGIPTPKQLMRFLRSDVPSACILLSNSIRGMERYYVCDENQRHCLDDLHHYAERCMKDPEVEYPEYESIFSWLRIFLLFGENMLRYYCYEFDDSNLLDC